MPGLPPTFYSNRLLRAYLHKAPGLAFHHAAGRGRLRMWCVPVVIFRKSDTHLAAAPPQLGRFINSRQRLQLSAVSAVSAVSAAPAVPAVPAVLVLLPVLLLLLTRLFFLSVSSSTVTFAMTSPENDTTSRPAKVGHRKSRNGCKKCKFRRVKCDEVRPICGNCTRLKMDCSWPDLRPDHGPSARRRPSPSPRPASHLSPSTLSTGTAPTSRHTPEPTTNPYLANWPRWPSEENPFAQLDDGAGINMPESRARRLMEHRLMQNYYHTFAKPSPVTPAESWRNLWTTHIPALGLNHDNILYGIFASSATNLLQSNPNDKDLFAARQSYFISSLHEQRQEVARLTVENAESVCFGALLISMTSFAMLKERSLHPYHPPIEWLQVGRGAGTVIWQSVQTIENEAREAEHPALMTVATAYPYFGEDQSYFSPEMRRNFEGVLSQQIPSDDDWNDEELKEAYEKSLSYVGSIQRGINHGEPIYAITRRIQTFALLLPPRFIQLLDLQRPRALVIMAHFWATVSQIHDVWWLGESDTVGEESTAKREIGAIKRVLPHEWICTMVWPLDQVGLRDVS